MTGPAADTCPGLTLGAGVLLLLAAVEPFALVGCSQSVPLRSGNGYFIWEGKNHYYSGSVAYERFLWSAEETGRYRLRMGGWDGDRTMEIASDIPLYGDTVTIGRKGGPLDTATQIWARFEPAGEKATYWSDSGSVWTVTKYDIAAVDFQLFLSRRDSGGTNSIVLRGGVGLGLK